MITAFADDLKLTLPLKNIEEATQLQESMEVIYKHLDNWGRLEEMKMYSMGRKIERYEIS